MEHMNNINVSAETLLVSFQFSKMNPSWLIPHSQVKEWWRVEIRRRVALVQAEAPSRTPHQLICISWLGLYNVTSPASSLSYDHSCCCWLCWFIFRAFEHHAAIISYQPELVITSPASLTSLTVNWALFCTHLKDLLCSLLIIPQSAWIHLQGQSLFSMNTNIKASF